MRLTDLSIKAIKTPTKGAIVYHDDVLIGFGVRVSEGGTKSFVLTHGSQRHRETIGRVGVTSLHDARNEAKRRLAEYVLGKSRPCSMRWNTAIEEYFAEIVASVKPRTLKDYKRHLSLHFKFGASKLEDLRPSDFVQKLNRLTDRPSEYHHAFAVVHTFVEWAYRKNYFEHNPLARMKAPPLPKSRERTLAREELQVVLATALNGETIFDHIVATLVLTGQRRTQIGALRDDWIKSGLITIPAEYTKHIAHTFPVGPMTLSVLSRTPRAPKSPYLFPAMRERRKGQVATVFNSWGDSKADFDERLRQTGHEVAHWTLHDLRRTFRTSWAELGILREVAEKYIHHISGVHSGVSGIYDRYSYMPDMKMAVEKWETHLQTLVARGT